MKILLASMGVSLLFALLLPWLKSGRLIFLKSYLALLITIPLAAWGLRLVGTANVIGDYLYAPGAIAYSVSRSRQLPQILDGESALGFLLLSGYFLVAGVMVAWILISYLRARIYLARSVSSQWNDMRIFLSSYVPSPVTFGIFRPRIYAPKEFLQNSSSQDLRLAIEHEWNHVRSHDPAWKLISLLARAALWFSPAAWWLTHQFELELEIDCDRRTLESARVTVSEYGKFLVEACQISQTSFALASHVFQTDIKRRIVAMKTTRTSLNLIGGLCMILALLGSATAIAASAGASRFSGQYMIKAQIFVDGQLVSTPQIVSLKNEEALIEMKSRHPETELKLKVVATDFKDRPEAIELKMSVEYKNADRQVSANPHIAVLPGEQGSVTIAQDPQGTFEMKLEAQRL